MRSPRALLGWFVLAAAGAGLLIWAYPRAFPYAPRHWRITGPEAEAIALERLADLGAPVKGPYLVTRLSGDQILERRLQVAAGRRAPRELADRVVSWEVWVYKPEVQRDDWTYSARVGLAGEVLALRLRLDPLAPGRAIPAALARAQADAFLARQGIDLALYGEPELRSQQLARRTDLVVRYPDRRPTPGRGATHGLEVLFAGDRLAGFQPWFDDPAQHSLERAVQAASFADFGSLLVVYLLILVLCVPFLKRYHEGEIGVRRGVQIFLLVLAAGLVVVLLTARASAQGTGFGFATREQLTYLVVVFSTFFGIIPQAVLAFLAWSVGESICRERWGWKLAAFDALFQGEWANATVARASARGVSAGFLIAGVTAALLVAFQRAGAWALASNVVSNASSAWPGLQILASLLITALSSYLAVSLYLVPVAVRRLGRL